MDTPIRAVTTNGTKMTIPDYIISQTIAAEHQASRSRKTIDFDIPEPRPRRPEANDRLTLIRRQLAAALHTIANRIDQEPAGSC